MGGSLARRRARVVCAGLVTVLAATLVFASTAGAEAKPKGADEPGPRPWAKIRALAISRTSVLTGDRVVITGRATRTKKSSVVRLEVVDGDRWRTYRSTRTRTKRGTFRFEIRPPAGTRRFRIARPARTKVGAGFSSSFLVTSEPCVALRRPGASTALWTTKPPETSSTSVTRNTVASICAAAPGSTIKVAMYFIHANGAESTPIIQALERMARYRGVKVSVLVDSSTPFAVETVPRLRRFARVFTCTGGCFNGRPSGGTMHHKFMTISDTSWSAGWEPVVVHGSGNWNTRQLRKYWQSATLVQDDLDLWRRFNRHFDSLAACASAGCSPGAASYGLRRSQQGWATGGSRLTGSTGRGRHVWFSPLTADPVLTELGSYSCFRGGTIRIAQYYVAWSRGREIGLELGRLRREGCRVEVLIGYGGAFSSPKGGWRALKDQADSVRCVAFMHQKYATFDVVDRRHGTRANIVWDGSHNYDPAAVGLSDETLVTYSTATAVGRWAQDVKRLRWAYDDNWRAMNARSVACSDELLDAPPAH